MASYPTNVTNRTYDHNVISPDVANQVYKRATRMEPPAISPFTNELSNSGFTWR